MSGLNVVLGALAIFGIRVLSIAVSTIRLLLMQRIHPLITLILAFFEALAFALTFGLVAANLNNLWNLAAYCLGFAVGTLVGMWLDKRLATGFATVNIISTTLSGKIADTVRKEGFGATRSLGEGTFGEVGLIRVVIRRRNISRIVAIAQGIDPQAFVTIEETSSVSHGYL